MLLIKSYSVERNGMWNLLHVCQCTSVGSGKSFLIMNLKGIYYIVQFVGSCVKRDSHCSLSILGMYV